MTPDPDHPASTALLLACAALAAVQAERRELAAIAARMELEHKARGHLEGARGLRYFLDLVQSRLDACLPAPLP